MAGPFANPWQYAAQRRKVGRRLRWCMVNTCHNRVLSDHDTREEVEQLIADRLACLKAIKELSAYCKGAKHQLFLFPLPPQEGNYRFKPATPTESTMKRATVTTAKTSKKSAPPPAVISDSVAAQRSAAARQAWATRRAQGWQHPRSTTPPPAPPRAVAKSTVTLKPAFVKSAAKPVAAKAAPAKAATPKRATTRKLAPALS